MRESRNHFIVLGLVFLVLGAVFAVGYTKGARLGLDLQGGLEIVLRAQPKGNEKLTAEDLTKSVEIIRDRVDKLGVSEPTIRTQAEKDIAIALPGIKNPEAALKVLGSTAQLKFYNYEDQIDGFKFYRNPYEALKRKQFQVDKDLKAKKQIETWFLFDKSKKVIAGPTQTKKQLYTEFDGVQPKGSTVFGVPYGRVLLHGLPDFLPGAKDSTDASGQFDREDHAVYFLMKDKLGKAAKNVLTGAEIERAAKQTDQGGWVTSIDFSKRGGKLFQKITKDIAKQGALEQFDNHFAVVLDDEVKSAPTISFKDYPNGISGGQAIISGLDNEEEAKNLALVLNTGALPVKFVTLSKTQVSATLGKQSLTQGLYAGAIGLLIVMIYLALFYRVLGLIADIALLIYAFIFYGLIVGIPIVMTLPGIAGIILTIGVAADANIIIFERVREEYRAGRNVRSAIAAGYSKGLRTIVDANVITLITAFVLFVWAAGEVRGFALLLGVGVVLSMFTAVAVTFALLGLLGNLKAFRHPFVIGGSRKPLRFHINWMKYRHIMYGFTALVILFAGGALIKNGLNLGIDFKSGTRIDVAFAGKVSEKQVRSVLGDVDSKYANATIQQTTDPVGTDRKARKGTSYTIELEKLAGKAKQQQEEESRLRRALDNKLGIEDIKETKKVSAADDGKTSSSFSITTVGPSFGKAIARSAEYAIAISLVLVVLYVWARFEWKFAFPVMIALIHDMIIALGAYAITGREFTSATVAALLTILGYSMYDTIIVFDRVRENVKILRKSSYAKIVDRSLNEVLMRSINTSIVTLLPVATIFLFGGETLKDFAWALLIGIFAGAYSSLVVASPVLVAAKEREVTWAKRKGIDTYGADAAKSPAKVSGEPAAVVEANGNGHVEVSVANPEGASASSPVQGGKDKRSRAERRKK